MEILKRIQTPAICLTLCVFFFSCSQVTETQVIQLDSDTYIQSNDLSDHADLPSLRVAKDATEETRAIVKLPTGDQNTDQDLQQALSNPVVVLASFIIFPANLAFILDCQNTVIQPQNLTSAKLVFNVLDNQQGDLTNQIDLLLLAKGWWQNASWDHAHYFSSTGKWATPGGDTDSSFTTVVGAPNGNTLEFDITTYFKDLIEQTNPVHYGMMLEAAGATLNPVTLASTQYSDSTARPRVVAVYTGSCLNQSGVSNTPRTFILGSKLKYQPSPPAAPL